MTVCDTHQSSPSKTDATNNGLFAFGLQNAIQSTRRIPRNQLESKKTASIEYYRSLSQLQQDANDAVMMGRMAHICAVCEPALEQFHLEELQFQVNEEDCHDLLKESPIVHSNTLSRILEAESSDEDTEPERSSSRSTKNGMEQETEKTNSGKKTPITAVDILKKSSSVQFYRKFLRSNRELCAVMKERQQE